MRAFPEHAGMDVEPQGEMEVRSVLADFRAGWDAAPMVVLLQEVARGEKKLGSSA